MKRVLLILTCSLLVAALSGVAMYSMLDGVSAEFPLPRLQPVLTSAGRNADRIVRKLQAGYAAVVGKADFDPASWLDKMPGQLAGQLAQAEADADRLATSMLPMFADIARRANAEAESLKSALRAVADGLGTRLNAGVQSLEPQQEQAPSWRPALAVCHSGRRMPVQPLTSHWP